MPSALLTISNLNQRHPGLTAAIASYYYEGASVCLSRHHQPPQQFLIEMGAATVEVTVEWVAPTEPVVGAWANDDEATRDGAYAVSLAALELHTDLVAIGRAENRTGADYYVAPKGTPAGDFEVSYRLEVSGTDRGDASAIRQRLEQKKQQARRGDSDLPALAAVVGFRSSTVVMAYVDGLG